MRRQLLRLFLLVLCIIFLGAGFVVWLDLSIISVVTTLSSLTCHRFMQAVEDSVHEVIVGYPREDPLSFGDALWLTIASLSTVGYGDKGMNVVSIHILLTLRYAGADTYVGKVYSYVDSVCYYWCMIMYLSGCVVWDHCIDSDVAAKGSGSVRRVGKTIISLQN